MIEKVRSKEEREEAFKQMITVHRHLTDGEDPDFNAWSDLILKIMDEKVEALLYQKFRDWRYSDLIHILDMIDASRAEQEGADAGNRTDIQ